MANNAFEFLEENEISDVVEPEGMVHELRGNLYTCAMN